VCVCVCARARVCVRHVCLHDQILADLLCIFLLHNPPKLARTIHDHKRAHTCAGLQCPGYTTPQMFGNVGSDPGSLV